jgi:hypothetical protein
VVDICKNKRTSYGKHVDKKMKADINRLMPNFSFTTNADISPIIRTKKHCEQDQQSTTSISEWVYTIAAPIIQETTQVFHSPFYDEKNWIEMGGSGMFIYFSCS